ncbi:Hypothetical protein KLENKIAIHU_3209, partial [Klenkia terrae]|jgi:hypothetical protein
VATTTAAAAVPRATGSRTDSAGAWVDAGCTAALCAAAAASAASAELSVPSAGEGTARSADAASLPTSPGATRVPTPLPVGVAKPQSSSRSACWVVETG